MTDTGNPIRVLIVDDSAYMRYTLSKYLSEMDDIVVAGTARNGLDALEMVPRLTPDVMTLDVEMPKLDGLSTLRRLMAENPLPVIMLSSLTKEGATETVQALTLGAIDFIAKPTTKADLSGIIDDLHQKIRTAAGAKVSVPLILRNQQTHITESEKSVSQKLSKFHKGDRLIVIGTSTGGPRALSSIIPELKKDMDAAFVIIQHMPVGFTRSLAERLDHLSELDVREAVPGDYLTKGRALVAPGGFHLQFDKQGMAILNQNPTVHGVRPAVDVTLSSLAQNFGADCVTVIMTGMGHDGTNGAMLVHAAGGKVIAEDESTCVVWGMPRSVVEAGVADDIVPLNKIPRAIRKALRSPLRIPRVEAGEAV